MAKESPTQRALKFLRAAGHTAAVTERWNPHAHIRQDLFGFIDVIAMHPGEKGLLAVQTTSGSNHAARRAKILAEPKAKLWCECGNRIWVISFSKTGDRGKRKLWTPRIEAIVSGDFEEAAEAASPTLFGTTNPV